jgi:aryl-alcohol dehydrogenase-like predicted oxidoreductase
MYNKIILGSAQFGLNYGINNKEGKLSTDKVFEILNYCKLNKINFIDTADAYGDSSKIIGEFQNTTSFNFSINTKFKTGSTSISEQLSNSLKLLFTKSIDTYFFHSYNDFINFPKISKELIHFKQEGKISKIGLSIYDNSEFKKAIESPLIDVIQIPFNLLDNINHRGGLLLKAKEKNKIVQARSVFLQGLFFKNTSDLPQKLRPLEKDLIKIRNIAHVNNISIEKLALQYVSQIKEIDNIIIGVDNLDQLEKNIKYLENELSPQIIRDINQIYFKPAELLYPKNWN